MSKGTYSFNGFTITLNFTEVDLLHEVNIGITVGSELELTFKDNNTIRNSTGDEWRKTNDSNVNTVERNIVGTSWEQDMFGYNVRLTATGLNIATGTGNLFQISDHSAYPFVFLLLIFPLALLIIVFILKSINVLGIISGVGLLLNIAYVIIFANVTDTFGIRQFYFMNPNILVFLLYIWLCFFAFFHAK